MEYPLKQYGCSRCGALTDVLDIDAPLPKGWMIGGSHTHFCPECAGNISEKILQLRRAGYSVFMIARLGGIDEDTVNIILDEETINSNADR